MDALALEPSERAFLEALERLGVRYLIIGMSAALLQGARGVTETSISGSSGLTNRQLVKPQERQMDSGSPGTSECGRQASEESDSRIAST
jgi:hypothetical protein